MSKTGKYYDYAPLLSHNALIACAVGGRGIGKTFGAKKLAIDDFIKGGWHFMYVRRYKGELQESRSHFFDDIAEQYANYIFRIHNGEAQIAAKADGKTSWQTFGFFHTLSTIQKIKSTAFPKVKRIIFDEFIPEKGATQYLANEHHIVLNLLNTVDRHSDRVNMIMLANAVSIENPHFLAYGIVPKPGKIAKYADGLVAVDFPNSDAYNKAVAHTRTARLFAHHESYNAYATLNEFADNAPTMVERKSAASVYKWTLELSNRTVAVWYDETVEPGHWYVTTKRPRNDETILTIHPGNMDHNKMFVTFTDLPMSRMRTAFRHGRMSFDTPTTRNAMTEIFKR